MAKDMTLLWGSGSPTCMRIMITLEEKNLQGYNQKMLSFEKGEQKSKEVMDINPRGQLPAFKHKDYKINESIGACLYLEDQFKSQGNRLIPDNQADVALMYQRMFENSSLQEKLTNVVYYSWRVPEAERHDSAVKRNKEALTAEFHLWEGYLGKAGSYLAGKTFSLADVTVFPTIAYAKRFGLSAERYPKLTAYHEFIKARPSVKASWPPTWKDSPCTDDLKDV